MSYLPSTFEDRQNRAACQGSCSLKLGATCHQRFFFPICSKFCSGLLASLEDSKAQLGTDVGRKLSWTREILNQNNTVIEKSIIQIKMKLTWLLAFGCESAGGAATMQPLLQAGLGSAEGPGIHFPFSTHPYLQEHICSEHDQGMGTVWASPDAGFVLSTLPGLDLVCANSLSDCARTWVRPPWLRGEHVSGVGTQAVSCCLPSGRVSSAGCCIYWCSRSRQRLFKMSNRLINTGFQKH